MKTLHAGAVQPNAMVAAATSGQLAVPYRQQSTGYYCAPATMAMIVRDKGHAYGGTATQQPDAAAAALHTTTDGTSWYDGHRLPQMQTALNAPIATTWYVPVSLPGSPTAAQANSYLNALMADVIDQWPFAANQDSIPDTKSGTSRPEPGSSGGPVPGTARAEP